MDGLVRKRAIYKRKITLALADGEVECVSDAVLDVSRAQVRVHLKSVQAVDEEIVGLLIESKSKDDDLNKEVDSQAAYATAVELKLKALGKCVNVDHKTAIKFSKDIKLPQLKIDNFSGEGSDVMKYHAFITKFHSVIDGRDYLSPSAKLTYLKSYLTGYAYKVLEHLTVVDDNYAVALKLLSHEFMNKDALVDQLCSKLFSLKCKYDQSYHETRIFITTVRSLIADLKLYECNILDEGAALKIVSSLVFSKLPSAFRQELARKVNTNYPNLIQLFDNYVSVIEILSLRSSRLDQTTSSASSNNSFGSHKSFPKKYEPKVDSKPRQVFSNATVNSVVPKRPCKFCSGSSHSMLQCAIYPSHQARVTRCTELKICSKCTSSKHAGVECTAKLDFDCKFCNERRHISALCPRQQSQGVLSNVCLHSSVD